MEKTSFYFVVFNQTGIVKYEYGKRLKFIDNFISKINLSCQAYRCTTVQDNMVEYEIRGPIIYLSVYSKEILHKILENYDFDKNCLVCEPSRIEESERNKKISKKHEDVNVLIPENNLDFSATNKNSVSSSISEYFYNTKAKIFTKVYTVFSSKIDVETVQDQLNQHLIRKNVSPSLVPLITNDVVAELRANGIKYVYLEEFKQYMSRSIKKYLKTVDFDKFSNDILQKKTTFSIFLTGPNGVGKSTTLAKLTNFFFKKKNSVCIAASDTFRAGAIEQLAIHVERFKERGERIGFYESGYSKEESKVAKTAIFNAQNENYDVILVDTAGRTHNNQNLMRSLTKLCSVNNPDHVIFVGEALTGGDSLDQIKNFNSYISKGRVGKKPIDSIILTKVEAVLSKIGQIINLSFSTGIPIMFLGVGQTYNDIIQLDIEKIVDLLLSE